MCTVLHTFFFFNIFQNLLDGTATSIDDNGGIGKKETWEEKGMADSKPTTGLCSDLVEICLEEGSSDVNNLDDSIDIEEFEHNTEDFNNVDTPSFQETDGLKTATKRTNAGLTIFEEELIKLAKEKHAKEMKKLDLEIEILTLKRKKLMTSDG